MVVIPDQLYIEIDTFCKSKVDSGNGINLKELQCEIEKLMFVHTHYDSITKDYPDCYKKMVERCFKNFERESSTNERFTDFKTFKKEFNSVRFKRYICGVVAMSDKGLLVICPPETLCCGEMVQKLTFPKGKEDYSDKRDKKVTAFREFEEETGIKLSSDEKRRCDSYIVVKQRKPVRLYLITVASEIVNLSYQRKGEVERLQWLPYEDVKKIADVGEDVTKRHATLVVKTCKKLHLKKVNSV